MPALKGSCHCGNIKLDIEITRSPDTYEPRACDCDFCRKHGASYVSDPDGTLRIEVSRADLLRRYKQGSGTADCLLCAQCGVLVGVAYDDAGRTFAAVNRAVIDGGVVFGATKVVSPRLLEVGPRMKRWREIWFSHVSVVTSPPGAVVASFGDPPIQE